MDEISDEYENWPDPIIELPPLNDEKASIQLYHQHHSFSFDEIFLKLANKVDMDEI